MLSLNARITKRQDQLTSEIDGKVILLGNNCGKYFAFDDISTDIWNRLDTYPLLADLCNALSNAYDANLETIQADVCKLITVLAEHQLIVVDD
ncbi:PqqD family protein [Pseudomonas sp. LRF_L74]|uniref:PqqD family protein n=1 Tax=Pseudomonas sp. LRF_L74 TaxID=3369422 RepID=UPI003F63E0A6